MEEEDEVEVVDDEELVRWALLRGIIIRVTSSALIGSSPSPVLVELHRSGCKLGGDATAVIGVVESMVRLSRCTLCPLIVAIPLACKL
jgi:hypothetical protein